MAVGNPRKCCKLFEWADPRSVLVILGRDMVVRPTSVTVLAMIQLVFGVLGVLIGIGSFIPGSPAAKALSAERAAEIQAKTSLPIPIQHANRVASITISLVCGYFLLQGKNWARILYVTWESLHHLLFLCVGGTSPRIVQLPGILMFVAFTVLLFRPQANAFFAVGGRGLEAQPWPSARRVLSFVFYVLSGMFFMGTCLTAFLFTPLDVAKWLVISFQLLPATVFLSIGRALSPERNWAKEVGIVLLVSAASGAFGGLMFFMHPEYHKAIPPGSVDLFGDVTTGCLWIALMAAFGGLWFLSGQRQAREKPVRAPIFGASRR
jgi:hypothetical protein